MAERKQIGFPGEVVDRVDVEAAAVGQSRSEWALQAVEERLAQPRSRQRMGVEQGRRAATNPPNDQGGPAVRPSISGAKMRARPAIPKRSK